KRNDDYCYAGDVIWHGSLYNKEVEATGQDWTERMLSRMAMEIERKFLLPEFPQALIDEGKLVIRSEQRIEQTYLAMDDQQELRVRRIQDIRSGETSYTHTFKNGNGLVREEVEYGISGEIYEQII